MTDQEEIIQGLQNISDEAYGRWVHCQTTNDELILGIGRYMDDAIRMLKEQHEQKKGHWVFDPDGIDWNIPAWCCSECHCRNYNIPPNIEKVNPLRWEGSKFCPNCGAKMDEEVKQDGRT